MKDEIKKFLAARGVELTSDAAGAVEEFIRNLPAPRQPLVQLPSGAVINLEKVAFIARKEIGQYAIMMQNDPRVVMADLRDLEALAAYGIVQALEAPPVEAANDSSKIETAG